MAVKHIFTLGILVLVASCGNNGQSNMDASAKGDTGALKVGDISQIEYLEFALDRKVEALAEPWEAYTRLQETVEGIKRADFSFFNVEEKAANILIRDLKSTVPDTLNTTAVLSRILVVETMLKKMDETVRLSTSTKTELSRAVKDVLESYSNLNFQLNKKIEKDQQKILRPTS